MTSRFDSVEMLLRDYVLFRAIIAGLDSGYFIYMTRDEIIEEKRSLLRECAHDYSL